MYFIWIFYLRCIIYSYITCPSFSSLGAIAMEFGMDIIVTYGTFSIIYILVTTDVVGDNWCGRFGLWPFRSVAVSVCGRSGQWPFRSVAVPVCGRFGLWPFGFVAVPVCGRFGLWPFRFWPLRFVAVMTRILSTYIYRTVSNIALYPTATHREPTSLIWLVFFSATFTTPPAPQTKAYKKSTFPYDIFKNIKTRHICVSFTNNIESVHPVNLCIS